MPTQFFQMIWMYLLLSLHLLSPTEEGVSSSTSEKTHRLPGTRIRLRIPWWIYFGVSVLDVFPNFLTLLSLRYTSLTSTTLLGSLTVPSTMIFSYYILAKCFAWHHYLGVSLCLLGGSLTVLSDAAEQDDDRSVASHHMPPTAPYLGDLLAVLAALLYGLGDAVAEYSIKHIDRREYLGVLGLFGMIQTILFCIWLERDTVLLNLSLSDSLTQLQTVGVLVWYVASVYGYYEAESVFLLSSDATLLNLSMQASNFWAIAFSVTAYSSLPSLLFYMALLLVVSGVFVYELLRRNETICDKGETAERNETTLLDLEGLALVNDVDNRNVKVYGSL